MSADSSINSIDYDIQYIHTQKSTTSDELIKLSQALSQKYSQVHVDCFTSNLREFDKIDDAKFFILDSDLILNITIQNKSHTINCNNGIINTKLIGGKEKEESLAITIDGFLGAELLKNKVDFHFAYQIQDLLLNYDDISNRPINGRLKVIYTKTEAEPENLYKIIALSLKKRSRREIQVYLDEENGVKNYYDKYKNYLDGYVSKAPVKFGIITSWYDKERLHPVTKESRPHFGTDYAATKGDPIYAIQSGIIDKIEFKRNNGNYIKIKHPNNVASQYLHMQRFKKNLSKGDFVQKNDIIGYVGATGLATAPHVCYRFWDRGKQTNHLKYKDIPNKMTKNKIEKLRNYTQKLNQKLKDI